jgi:4-amino-4-deoxy-L-arabinose transferase-like glycosyltransferase
LTGAVAQAHGAPARQARELPVRRRRHLPFGLAVFALALAVRCAFALHQGLAAPPPGWGDDLDYDLIARRLVTSHVYQNTWFPPGYPLLLAAVYALSAGSLAAVRLVQAALSAATCWVVYAIGREAFGRQAGWVAAVLLAVYPGHVYMAWRLMAETPFALLIALAVLATQRAAAHGSLAAAAGAGLALGAATLFKSNLLLLAPLLALWLPLAMPGSRRRRAAAVAAMAGAGALVLAALPLANRLSPAHQAAWLPGNGGPTLWWSNNPLADGYFVDPDETPAGRAFIAHHGMAAAAAARDPFVRGRADRELAVDWIREHPGAFVALAGRKLWNAWSPLPHAALFSREPAAARVQALTFGLLLPFIAAGLWLARRRWRQAMPLYLAVASYAVMTVVFYGTPRFTLVIVPELLVFAGLALCAAAARLVPSVAVPWLPPAAARWRRSAVPPAPARPLALARPRGGACGPGARQVEGEV